jgi:hypothetical protein
VLRKQITFTNADDEKVTQTFYFNLTEAELAKMQMSTEGGLEKTLKEITETNNVGRLIELFDRIIFSAYGVKGLDGSFYKNQLQSDIFKASEAYSVLFLELLKDNGKGVEEFIRGLAPKSLVIPTN